MNSIESIGENIRILRLKNDFSQEQLALSAGVNTSYIGQIERGEKNPMIKILEQISIALEITLVDLLTLYDPKGGVGSGCHPSALTITPETIKQCLLEVLMDNTNMIIENKKNTQSPNKKEHPKGTLPLPDSFSPGTYSTNSDSLH
ncbi:helix-turn-helix domain-containing protein [Paenibacillus sp. FSL H3-0333]|uniref:helix-turn-helix domain-containing protein n=1 Tax=Paenibacillus sp. FSL H3-0333 TaxID=2921373 RepID=UPI0030F9AAB9